MIKCKFKCAKAVKDSKKNKNIKQENTNRSLKPIKHFIAEIGGCKMKSSSSEKLMYLVIYSLSK